MKNKLLLSALACGLLLSTTAIQAKSDTKTLVQQQIKQNKKAFKKAPKEVVTALKESSLAMKSLQNKKNDEAKKHLKTATENFNKALKDNPSLDIIPIEEHIEVYESTASADMINDILTSVQESLVHYKLEDARMALEPLKDEMDIQSVSIPMKLFPVATQKALDALNKNDAQKAMAILAEGYSTLVMEESMIPLPILKAQDLILDASLLGKSQKKDAKELLEAAKEELKRAKVLGYTTSHTPEYKALNDAIDVVKKEIKGKNAVVKLYDKLKDSISSLIHKSKEDVHKKAEAKVNAYENKEAVKAVDEQKTFKNEAKQDTNKTTK